MAVDFDLVIQGVTGENTRQGRPAGSMTVINWGWGAQNAGTMAFNSGGSGGQAQFQDLRVNKFVDSASNKLLYMCAQHAHIPTVTLQGWKSGGQQGSEQQKFLEIVLTKAVISNIQQHVAGSNLEEMVTFNFAQVDFHYFQQNEDGSLGTSQDMSWNVTTGTGSAG